jgi:hypothetical protein
VTVEDCGIWLMMNNPAELELPYLEPTPYLRCTPRTAERERERAGHTHVTLFTIPFARVKTASFFASLHESN